MKNFDVDVLNPSIQFAISLSKASIFEYLKKTRLETYVNRQHKLHLVSYSQYKNLLITVLPNILIYGEEQAVSSNIPVMPREIFNI